MALEGIHTGHSLFYFHHSDITQQLKGYGAEHNQVKTQWSAVKLTTRDAKSKYPGTIAYRCLHRMTCLRQANRSLKRFTELADHFIMHTNSFDAYS